MSDSHTDADDNQRDQGVTRPRDREDPGANPGESGKWVSVIVALLGPWLVVETVWTDPAVLFWNDLIIGGLLTGLGSYNYSRRNAKRVGSFGVATLIVLLGLWLIISPFALGPTVDSAGLGFWNHILVGVTAIVLGGYSAYETTKHPPSLTPG